MSRFTPVFLPDGRGLRRRVSQTGLRHYAGCPRAGFLYAAHRGGVRTTEMERGRAVHEVARRMIDLAVENGEPVIPGDVAKVIADEVLADAQFSVPFEEHDRVREMAFRLASELAVDPGAVVACETLYVLDVSVPCPVCRGAGELARMVAPPDPQSTETHECPECVGAGVVSWEVRCRVDLAEVIEGGRVCVVQDYKSGLAAPPLGEVARRRPDGSLAGKAFQLVLYALVLAYGVPVREEPCGICDGRPDCTVCNGRGVLEFREPFPVASRAQEFRLEFVYPGIEDREGRMLRRPVTLTRLELEAYLVSLGGLIGRLQESERSGDWPAVVSDAACGECPASALCPIPAELRDHRGTVNSVVEAAEAFSVRERVAAEQRAVGKELRAFVIANGAVRFGDGMVAEIAHERAEEIRDKDGMFAAQERAVRYGEAFDRSEWVRAKDSFKLRTRALTADELLEVALDEQGDEWERIPDRSGPGEREPF